MTFLIIIQTEYFASDFPECMPMPSSTTASFKWIKHKMVYIKSTKPNNGQDIARCIASSLCTAPHRRACHDAEKVTAGPPQRLPLTQTLTFKNSMFTKSVLHIIFHFHWWTSVSPSQHLSVTGAMVIPMAETPSQVKDVITHLDIKHFAIIHP